VTVNETRREALRRRVYAKAHFYCSNTQARGPLADECNKRWGAECGFTLQQCDERP